MGNNEKEKMKKTDEAQASAARTLESVENLPNIDIDQSAMIVKIDRNISMDSAAAEEPALNVPPRPESKKHHGTLDLPIDLYERLRLFSFQRRRSINSVVEESLRLYLDVRVDTSV